MICPTCNLECRRFGKHRNGLQRFHCSNCKKTYTEKHERPLDNMTVPFDKAVLALQLLIGGNSVRSSERISGLHRDTILRVMVIAASVAKS